MNKRTLPTILPSILNIVAIISFVWFLVDVDRGHSYLTPLEIVPVLKATSFVWLALCVLAICNSIAIRKFNKFLESI